MEKLEIMSKVKNLAYGITGLIGIDSTGEVLQAAEDVAMHEITATDAGTIIDLVLKAIVAIVTVIGILKKRKQKDAVK